MSHCYFETTDIESLISVVANVLIVFMFSIYLLLLSFATLNRMNGLIINTNG